MNVNRKGVKLFISVFVLLICYNQYIHWKVKKIEDILYKSALAQDSLAKQLADTTKK